MLKIRGGREIDSLGKRAGKGALIQWNKSMTLGASQDQTLFVWKETDNCIKSSEQQLRQFAEVMQKLSHQSTSPCQTLFDMWSKGEGIWLLQQTLYSIQKIRKPSLGEWKGGDGMMDVSTSKTVVRRLTPL